MAKQLQLQLLILDLSIEDVNLERFIKYVETVKQPFHILNESYQKKISVLNMSHIGQILKNLPSSNSSAVNIIE